MPALNGRLGGGFDGTLLLKKRQKLLPNLPYTDLVGVFSLTDDLGLRWKHNAWISYTQDDLSLTFSQIYRDGYANQVLSPAAAARPDFKRAGEALHHLQRLDLEDVRAAADAEPRDCATCSTPTRPSRSLMMAISARGGGGWEPRVADPRGRSFTLAAEVKF